MSGRGGDGSGRDGNGRDGSGREWEFGWFGRRGVAARRRACRRCPFGTARRGCGTEIGWKGRG